MASFRTKEELLQAINEGFDALNRGVIDVEQMNGLVASTRELYERAVIIQHKAHELVVREQPVVFTKDVAPSSVSVKEVVTEEVTDFKEDSIIEQAQEEAEVVQEETVSATPHQQPTFSVEEKEEGFTFDLFATKEEEKPTFEMNSFHEEPMQESYEETEAEMIIHEESTNVTNNYSAEIEEEIELPKTIAEIIRENPTTFLSNEGEVQPIIEELDEEMPEELEKETVVAMEEDRVEEPVKVTHSVGDTSFFNNYQPLANNPAAMMIAPKIDNLTSAFGLGEKLMYIRELFNGSSDAFNQVITEVEKGQSFQEAKILLSVIASDNAWSLDNQTTLDFVNKVERRFF